MPCGPGFAADLALLYERADRAPAGSDERKRLLREAAELSHARRRARVAMDARSQARRARKSQRA